MYHELRQTKLEKTKIHLVYHNSYSSFVSNMLHYIADSHIKCHYISNDINSRQNESLFISKII